jgi:hypothetical protein
MNRAGPKKKRAGDDFHPYRGSHESSCEKLIGDAAGRIPICVVDDGVEGLVREVEEDE